MALDAAVVTIIHLKPFLLFSIILNPAVRWCSVKYVSKERVIFSFNSKHEPVERVKPSELIVLEAEDAFGGQVKSEGTSLETLDWTRVDGATGPIYVEGAVPNDTLVVEILDIKPGDKGVIAVIPGYGALGSKEFRGKAKFVALKDGFAIFDGKTRVKIKPMIGTIGVAPPPGEEIPTSTPGRHGGNMDVKDVTSGTKLYLPVFAEGALFAAGDLHAVQADGELCVSSIEVAGQTLLRFDLIKGKSPRWPILETADSYMIIVAAEDLDKAAEIASREAVEALMREHGWSFEEAYMFGSLAVELKINQVVDPKKGVRAAIPKEYITLESLLR